MQTSKLEEIDRQLSALGSMPGDAQLVALLRKYAGQSVTLANVDALLDALGHAVVMPPRLQPTMVDIDAPAAEVVARAEPQAPAFDEPVIDHGRTMVDLPAQRDEQDFEPEASGNAPSFDEGMDAVVSPANAASVAPEPASSRLPWESDSPASIEPAPPAEVHVPPARPAPDFAALFGEDSMLPEEPSRVLDAPAVGAISSLPPRKKHDTIEHMPAVMPRLASVAMFDLPNTSEPPPVQRSKPPEEDQESPEISLGDGDEFEILVDDEILEIDEGDVSTDE